MLSSTLKAVLENNKSLKTISHPQNQRKKSVILKAPAYKNTLDFTTRITIIHEPADKENIPPIEQNSLRMPPLSRSSKKITLKPPTGARATLIKIKNSAVLSLVRPNSINPSPAASPSRSNLHTSRKYTAKFSQRRFSISDLEQSGPDLKNIPDVEILQDMLDDEKNNMQATSLKNHSIKPTHRARMTNWMIEVLAAYKFTKRTYFLACAIMDNFLRVTNKMYTDDDVHIIGITAMYIASKMEEIRPMFLKEVFYNVGHEAISIESMKRKQLEMVKALDYNLLYTTSIQFLYFYEHIGAIENLRIKDFAVTLLIMTMYDQNMQKYLPSVLAAAAVKAAIVNDNKGKSTKSKILDQIFSYKNKEITKCAQELIQLQVEFGCKYPNMSNMFHYILQD